MSRVTILRYLEYSDKSDVRLHACVHVCVHVFSNDLWRPN